MRLVLYREWRPQTFSKVVAQKATVKSLRQAVERGRVGHAYLFAGPRGTGKTSVAKILAKAVNCADGVGGEPCNVCGSCQAVNGGTSLDVVEVDAASNRGIDEIRSLKEKIQYPPGSGQKRVYIIDEVHMLTQEAANALLKTLEEPPAYLLFILATTDPDKLPATVHSRCQRFDFHRLGVEDIRARLEEVAKAEGVEAEEAALTYIARRADGGLRDALSLLDQALLYETGKLSLEGVLELLGAIPVDRLRAFSDTLVAGDLRGAAVWVQGVLAAGGDPVMVMRELAYHYRDLLLAQVSPDLLDPPAESSLLLEAGKFSQSRLLQIVDSLLKAQGELKWSPSPALALEVALLGLLDLGVASLVPVDVERAVSLPTIGNFLEEIRRVWPKVLEAVKRDGRATHAILSEGEPVEAGGDQVVVSFPYPFHRDKMAEEGHRRIVRAALARVLGREVQLEVVLGEEEHRLVQRARDIFGADKVRVGRNAGGEEGKNER